MSLPQFKYPPPPTSLSRLSFPAPYVLLVTLARPRVLNCINHAGHHELHRVWEWLDREPSLRVGIIAGEGRAFCAGADLKEWQEGGKTVVVPAESDPLQPASGFGGLSNRKGRKPVIAAVDGACLGGGLEMVVNCDLVLASARATFGLPEAKVGVAAIAGALPRLPRVVGRQRAMEMALTGRTYGAGAMREWGLVNAVVEPGVEGGVVGEAVRWAEEIAGNSPDSVVGSREGILMGWDGIGVQEATGRLVKEWWARMEGEDNLKEGLQAWVERRRPHWVASKL